MSVPVRRRVRVFVTGTVQGVSFRRFAQVEALRLHLCGWVRNLRDGRVEAEAEGAAPEILKFVDLLRRGPPRAGVTDVLVEDRPPTRADTEFDVLPTPD